MRTVTAVLEYEGQQYTYTSEWDDQKTFTNREKPTPLYKDEEDFRSAVEYLWTEGNYSCDCNRSSFICESCDDEAYPTFCEKPEEEDEVHYEGPLPCGETIKLVDLQIDGESILDDEEDVARRMAAIGLYCR